MSARRRGKRPRQADPEPAGSDSESFADAARRLGDVEPLAPGPARADLKPQPTARRERDRAGAGSAGFHRPDPDEPLLAHRDGIDPGLWLALQRGELRPETRIDLHGLDRESAGRRLTDQLRTAAAVGARVVLVVHGRGLRSQPGEAVLRSALPGWLAAQGLRRLVLAFAPARPRDGGCGATYVLLR